MLCVSDRRLSLHCTAGCAVPVLSVCTRGRFCLASCCVPQVVLQVICHVRRKWTTPVLACALQRAPGRLRRRQRFSSSACSCHCPAPHERARTHTHGTECLRRCPHAEQGSAIPTAQPQTARLPRAPARIAPTHRAKHRWHPQCTHRGPALCRQARWTRATEACASDRSSCRDRPQFSHIRPRSSTAAGTRPVRECPTVRCLQMRCEPGFYSTRRLRINK